MWSDSLSKMSNKFNLFAARSSADSKHRKEPASAEAQLQRRGDAEAAAAAAAAAIERVVLDGWIEAKVVSVIFL